MSEQNIGTVVQITGPVLDIKFAADALPKLLNAITIDNQGRIITVEVAQHIGQDTVRCIAMESTDGLVRGMKAVDTGGPITVPVGDKNLGRIFNLLGQPVDNMPAVEGEERWPIHRPAPVLRGAGIHHRDPRDRHQGRRSDRAVCKGRQDRSVRRRRRRQDGSYHGADQQHRQAARRHLGLHRRRRAYPRGQRPVQRDEGIRRTATRPRWSTAR